MNTLIQNSQQIFDALFYLHAAAVIIVNLTATPKDDKILGKAYKLIEITAGIFGAKAKQ